MRAAIQFVKDEFQIVPLTERDAKIFAETKEQYREIERKKFQEKIHY